LIKKVLLVILLKYFFLIKIMKKKLQLSDVTLLSVTSSEENEAQLSMRISLHNIDFGASKLLCTSEPKEKYPDIEYISIPKLKSVDDYNEIIFQHLHKYFKTTHCLIVQADSFVVNSSLWSNDFLKYDYIGGLWPDKIQVNPNLILDLKKILLVMVASLYETEN